jgi:hypothetical protein
MTTSLRPNHMSRCYGGLLSRVSAPRHPQWWISLWCDYLGRLTDRKPCVA